MSLILHMNFWLGNFLVYAEFVNGFTVKCNVMGISHDAILQINMNIWQNFSFPCHTLLSNTFQSNRISNIQIKVQNWNICSWKKLIKESSGICKKSKSFGKIDSLK